jgi:hypothetical protein
VHFFVRLLLEVDMAMETKVTMFRARDSSWQKQLVRLEVDRVSDSSVWLRGSRIARVSESTRICHDFETAKQWLQDELAKQIARHEGAIEALRKRLASVDATNECDIPDDDSRY